MLNGVIAIFIFSLFVISPADAGTYSSFPLATQLGHADSGKLSSLKPPLPTVPVQTRYPDSEKKGNHTSLSRSAPGAAEVKDTLDLWNNTLVQGNYVPKSGLQLSSVVDDGPVHAIFIADSASDNVVEINTTTHLAEKYIEVGGDPTALALDSSNGEIFVANGWTNNLTVINASLGEVVGSIPVGIAPVSLAFDPLSGLVYVANLGCLATPIYPCAGVGNATNISVVNPTVDSVIDWIPVPCFYPSLNFDSANELLYVTSENGNRTQIIDTITESELGWINTTKSSGAAALDSQIGTLFVASVSSALQVINLSKGIVVMNFTSGLNGPMAITLDEATQTLFVLNSNGTIVSLSTNGSEEGMVHLGGIESLSFDPIQGEIDALTFTNVDYLAPTVLTLIGSTTVGTGASILTGSGPGPPITTPDSVLLDAQGGLILVANYYAGNISLISEKTHREIADVPPSTSRQNPIALTLDPLNGLVYALYYDGCCVAGTLAAINPNNGTVVTSIAVGLQPTDVVYDPINNVLYVVNSGNRDLSIIDPQSNMVLRSIATWEIPEQDAVDPTNGYLYVSEWGCENSLYCPGMLQVLDPSTEQFVERIPIGERPEGIAFDPWDSEVFVAESYSNDLMIISSTNGTLIGSIPVGSSPYGICFDPLNGFLYVTDSDMYTYPIVGISPVADQGPDNLTEVNGMSNTVTGEISVGASPLAVTWGSSNDTLLVANSVSGTLSFVNPGIIPSPLLNITLSPRSAVIGLGGNVSLNASVVCQPLACPEGVNYTWNMTTYLVGTLIQNHGSTASFHANDSTGRVNVTVNVSIGKYSLGSQPATISITSLTSVGITPDLSRVAPGQSVTLVPHLLCEPVTCPSAAVNLTWIERGVNGSIRNLPNGSVLLVAGAVPGAINITLVVLMGTFTMSARGQVVIVTLLRAFISPNLVTLTPHQSFTLRLQLECSSDPCLGGETYSWSLSDPSLGTLSALHNASTNFRAGGQVGSVTIHVTVTLDQANVTASTQVSITAPQSTFVGLPSYYGYTMIGVVVAAAVTAVVVLLARKRKGTPGYRIHQDSKNITDGAAMPVAVE